MNGHLPLSTPRQKCEDRGQTEMGGHSTPRHFYTRTNNGSSGKMQQKMDNRGAATDLIQWLIIAGVIGGVLVFLAATFKYIVALVALTVIGLMIFGYFFKKDVKRKQDLGQIIIISMICLGIVGFVAVTPSLILGVLIVGGGLWYYLKAKQLAVLVLMVGVGLMMMLVGSVGLKALGVYP